MEYGQVVDEMLVHIMSTAYTRCIGTEESTATGRVAVSGASAVETKVGWVNEDDSDESWSLTVGGGQQGGHTQVVSQKNISFRIVDHNDLDNLAITQGKGDSLYVHMRRCS